MPQLPLDFRWSAGRPSWSPRRRALLLGYLNAMLWSVGNGLTTGPLVIYLIRDLGARGREVGLILAAPALVGVLRLFTPWTIAWFGGAKRACLSLSAVSYVLIWILPAVAIEGLIPRSAALSTLVALLCVHQLLEYMALAARWGWMADLVPRPIRGRYFGRAQILQLAVLIPALLLSGYFTDAWRQRYETFDPQRLLLGYAIPSSIGALALAASLAPLLWMPGTLGRPSGSQRAADPASRAETPSAASAASMLAPWRDVRFWPLLAFGCWLSTSNGLTQAAQNIYPKDVLGLGIFALAAMRTAMQLGQMGYAGWAGPFSDRYGNRPVLIASQWLLALAPLFFLTATPERPLLIAGAWIVWSAYAGLNICLPNLSLKLGGVRDAAAYVATYFGVTSVFYAVSTIAGGYLFDYFGASAAGEVVASLGGKFAIFFWAALALRVTAVVWLWMIPEPGAARWRDILARRANGKP